jgi:hypothetical protein
MHGMLSLAVLVAAFTIFAGWAAFLSVRLYRTCPLDQSRPEPAAQPEQQDQSETTAVGRLSGQENAVGRLSGQKNTGTVA